MSTDGLYHAIGLKGYRVEDTWKGESGALFVRVSVPRESLQCRSCAIDNNLAERMVKLPAILRKNSLFVGSESGGHRAAILLSIVASAKHCGVEPWAWLNAILTELPRRLASASSTGPPDLSDLLPDAWLKAHPEYRWTIDDLRKVERQRSRQQKSNKRGSQGP